MEEGVLGLSGKQNSEDACRLGDGGEDWARVQEDRGLLYVLVEEEKALDVF